jgi:hypothetical protein
VTREAVAAKLEITLVPSRGRPECRAAATRTSKMPSAAPRP